MKYFILFAYLSISSVCFSQSKFEGLEFPYTNEPKYGLSGDLYFPQFLKSLVTLKKPDCGHPYPRILSDFSENAFYVDGSCVWMKHKYVDESKKILSRVNEYMVVDVIQTAQYACETRNKINDKLETRGYLLPPFFKNDIKNHEGDYFVGSLPAAPNKEIFYNVFLKKKTRCDGGCCCIIGWIYYWHKMEALFKQHAITKAKLLLNETGIPKINKDTTVWSINIRIPFEKGRIDFKQNEYMSRLDSLIPESAEISSIDIKAYSSIEGSEEINMALQKKRAATIFDFIQQKVPGDYQYTVNNQDSYQEFVKLIFGTEFDSLRTYELFELRALLKAKHNLRKSLEPTLVKCRYGIIQIRLKNVKDFNQQEFFNEKYIQHLNKGEPELALMYQSSLVHNKMQNYRDPDYLSIINAIEIPFEPAYSDLLNNKLVYNYGWNKENDNLVIASFDDLKALDKSNSKVLYNYIAVRINDLIDQRSKNYDIKTSINLLQKEVNQLKVNKSLPKLDRNKLLSKFNRLQTVIDSTYIESMGVKSLLDEIEGPTDALYFAGVFKGLGRNLEAFKLLNTYIKKNIVKIKKLEDVTLRQELFTSLVYYAYAEGSYNLSSNLKRALKWFYESEPEYFCNMFKKGVFTYRMLEVRGVKKFYCETCDTN